MLVMNTDDFVMRRFVNIAVKAASHFWGAEESEFMLTMLHNMNIMQYINFLTISYCHF